MEIIHGHENLDPPTGTVAVIGTFDGIHIGHQRIIEATVAAAKEERLPSLLLTFDVHPRRALEPGRNIDVLMTFEAKLDALKGFGLDYVCALEFQAISQLTAMEFCRRILIRKAKIAHLFVGANFRFGARATGDPKWLLANGKPEFDVTVFPLEVHDDFVISSSKIRELLKAGRVEKIPDLMGRNIVLPGRVVRGAGRGAGLGFPTANLEFDYGLCQPGGGVYTGYLWINELKLPSVINCGPNPTFGDNSFHCEAHVLDFYADLYGAQVKIELATKLRDEATFPSPEALVRQITDDVHRAREWFTQGKR